MDGWRITGNNFVCLALFGINVILLIFAYFFLPNLTIEPAFKLVETEILADYNRKGSSFVKESDIKEGVNHKKLDINNEPISGDANHKESDIQEDANHRRSGFDKLSSDGSSCRKVSDFVKESSTLEDSSSHNGSHIHKKFAGRNTKKLWTTKDILTRFDIMFILIVQAIVVAAYCQLELLIVMTAIQDFNLTLYQIGLATTIAVIISASMMFLIEKYLLNSPNNIYFVFKKTFVFVILILTSINLTASFREYTSVVVLFLVVSNAIAMNNLLYYGYSCCSRWIVFAIVPSHSASFVESHRFNYGTLLSVFAYFTAPFVFEVMFYATIVYTVVFLLIIILLSKKRAFYLEKSK